MTHSPRGSSSDLERARAIAQRLSKEPDPGQPPAVADDGAGYVPFSAQRLQQGVAVPAPVRPDRRSPPPIVPALPLPVTLRTAKARAPAREPEPVLIPEGPAEPLAAAGFEVDFQREDSSVGAEAEDIIDQLVAEVEEEEETEPLSWPQILEGCVSVSQSRAGIILDAEGRILEASEQLPRNKLDAIAARLMQTMEEIPADARLSETSRSVGVQLGAFWLTGLRVPLGRDHVTVGLLASTQLPPEVLPAVAAQVHRAG